MYLLYCDEPNFERRTGDFFLYGGIAIDGLKAQALANELSALRRQFGVTPEFLLKFNPGPENMPHQTFVELKKLIIAAAAKFEVRLFVNLLLHDIATSSDDARRNGINTLCYHFDCFLHRPKVPGIVLIDRFTDKQLDAHLKEKIAVGLTGKLPYSDTMGIRYILGYHLTAVGQSHFCSLVDVIIGSMRFAVNAFTQGRQGHMETSASILQQISVLFFPRENTFQRWHPS